MCRDPLGRTGLSGKACPLALAASLSPAPLDLPTPLRRSVFDFPQPLDLPH